MNTQERNQQVENYIEAALALFSLKSEIDEHVIESMMFAFANEQSQTFDSLFLDLDEYNIEPDTALTVMLHERLINWLNRMSFKSIADGIHLYKRWIELRNEDYAEYKRDQSNEHYLSVNDKV